MPFRRGTEDTCIKGEQQDAEVEKTLALITATEKDFDTHSVAKQTQVIELPVFSQQIKNINATF